MDDRYAKKTGLGQKLNTLVLLLAILVIVFCIFTFLHLSFKLTSNDRAEQIFPIIPAFFIGLKCLPIWILFGDDPGPFSPICSCTMRFFI
jgi:hypothetical protein